MLIEFLLTWDSKMDTKFVRRSILKDKKVLKSSMRVSSSRSKSPNEMVVQFGHKALRVSTRSSSTSNVEIDPETMEGFMALAVQ